MNIQNGLIKRILYAVGANMLSLITSLLTTLVVPRFLGADVEQYGYLQIYLFYVGYLGFFHFGWCDGVFLRDGGKQYTELDKPLYSSQLRLLSVMEVSIAAVLCFIGFVSAKNDDYLFIWLMTALNLIVILPRTMLAYYLQTTNRIKEYASITTAGRLVYGISIVIVVIFLSKSYKWFVVGDLIGKLIALLVSIWWCRDIVLAKPAPIKNGIREGLSNISVGIKLLFANLASILISGIVRWGIQQQWDVATYGKVSLTLSVSSLLLTFIGAVALVLYPTLRRIEESKLAGVYSVIRNSLMVPLLGFLILYNPMKQLLVLWLPQYSEGLQYLAMLFPMCIYSAKMTLLVQTYMNVYRLEKQILRTNVFGVGVAIITTLISIFWLNNLTLAMLSMVFNQMFRCVLAELILAKRLQLVLLKDIIFEVIMAVSFIVLNWFVGGWAGVCIYIGVYTVYVCAKRNDIRETIQFFESGRNGKKAQDAAN